MTAVRSGDAAYEVSKGRFSWTPTPGRGFRLDGGWWPGTVDLADEYQLLARAVAERGYGRIAYLQANTNDWAEHPTTVELRGRTTSVGWFTMLFEHLVIVDCEYRVRLTLLVVPPAYGPAAAAAAMAMAADPAESALGDEILEAARTGRRPVPHPAGALRRLGYRIRTLRATPLDD